MHGAGDAVVQLNVELGELVVLDNARVGQITETRLVNHVPHRKALDSLILGRLRGAPIAKDLARVVAAVAVPPVVPPLNLRARVKELHSLEISQLQSDKYFQKPEHDARALLRGEATPRSSSTQSL